MKDIDNSGKADGIDRPLGIAIFIIDNLKHATSAEPPQRLGTRMLIAVLRVIDRKAHNSTRFVRESPQLVA
jgi:hypothetical protein